MVAIRNVETFLTIVHGQRVVVVADDRRDFHGAQQLPGPGAVARANAPPRPIP